MAINKILTVPEQILRKNSLTVEEVNKEIKVLLKDMLETMYDAPGIGLAAVQVGILKRLIVIDISKAEEKKHPLFLINPEIIHRSKKTSVYEEGCLSLPGQFAEIDRPSECDIEYLDYFGKKRFESVSGLLATCIQHEIDHLNGITIMDRQMVTTITNEKIGRNEKVTITNGQETKELKWKKAESLVKSGEWTRV